MEEATHEKPRIAWTKRLIIHPFAFGIFPVLSMVSTNIGEMFLREALLPVAIALLITCALYFSLGLVLRDSFKRGISVSIFWIGFYAAAPALDTLRDRLGVQGAAGPLQLAIALAAGAIGFAGLLVWLRITPRSFASLTAFLNLLAVFALIVPSTLTASRMAQIYRVEARPPLVDGTDVDPASYPDIYFIVLDAYTREDYLRQVFEYDNGPFLDSLRDRGFYIADKSRSNYMFTQMSLASTLNFDYIEEDLLENVVENWDAAVPRLAGKIWNSKTVAFLKERGYEFVTFPSYIASTEIRSADRYIKPKTSGGLTEFQNALINRTPFRVLMRRLDTPRIFPFFFPFDAIESLERQRRPMFVFAHVMAPHLPHTVDAEGRHYASPPTYIEGYRNEVAYLNKRIDEMLASVLPERPNSVFVIQGDHGPWSDWDGNAEGRHEPWRGTREDYIRDRTAILNAYYFPGGGYDALYPEITPVNTFRVLLNRFFGTDLPLLEDKTYLYNEDASEYSVIREVF